MTRDYAAARARAQEIGDQHMRMAGRTELADDDKAVGRLAFRRLLLIVPEALGGFGGRSEESLMKAAPYIGITLADVSDATWGKITWENPLPADFVWPTATGEARAARINSIETIGGLHVGMA